MVKQFNICVVALVLSVVFATLGTARGDDRVRKARVALALALSDSATAPAPKSKAPCSCGDDCKCSDTCPACPATSKAVATAPTPAQPKVVGYRQVCSNGRCYFIPIYEP